MLLTLEEVGPYLMERSLMAPRAVVDGRVRIMDFSRRNRVFKVILGDAGGLLVKQGGSAGAERASQVRLEGAIYQSVAEEESLRTLRWFTPQWHHSDASRRVLVSELVHPATSLNKFHLNGGKPSFPPALGQTVGRILGTLHKGGAPEGRDILLRILPEDLPYNFKLQTNFGVGPDGAFLSRSVRAMLSKAKGDPRFLRLLEEAVATWTPEAPLHGDVRFENFLVTIGPAESGLENMNIRLIDWELAIRGRPEWDVACYLGDHLRFWGMHVAKRRNGVVVKPAHVWEGDPDILQGFQLTAIRRSTRAFWREYVRTMEWTPSRAREAWTRVASYVPIALLRVALEQGSPFEEPDACTRGVFWHFQKSLEDPADFARRTYAIRDGGEDA
jgi:hypothetical protein